MLRTFSYFASNLQQIGPLQSLYTKVVVGEVPVEGVLEDYLSPHIFQKYRINPNQCTFSQQTVLYYSHLPIKDYTAVEPCFVFSDEFNERFGDERSMAVSVRVNVSVQVLHYITKHLHNLKVFFKKSVHE